MDVAIDSPVKDNPAENLAVQTAKNLIVRPIAPNTSAITLPNGLTIIHQEMATPAAVVDVWVRAGASKEPAAWAGMAHFLEHMVFKGTHRIQPGEFDWAIESQGGMTNAATSHDYAHFYITVAAAALPQTLPYLADLLLCAAIPADEFVRERQVVLEEIRQAYDNPDWVGYQALCELLYGDHVYSRAVLGTPEVLTARSPEEMRRFHQSHYQPENMTVVIAGGVSQQVAIDLVQQSFNRFASPIWCPEAKAEPLPKPVHQRRVITLPNIEQSRLTMAWMGPGIEDLPVACGLDLMSVLLGAGQTSRLVRELREERQLVQDVSSSFSLQADCSVLSLSMWLAVEDVETVERVVCDRIYQLSQACISHTELARAKRLLLTDYAFSTETPGQIAGLYGYYATIADPSLAISYPQQIQATTASSLQQIAQAHLNAERYTAVVINPD